jgi:hypothetical protein
MSLKRAREKKDSCGGVNVQALGHVCGIEKKKGAYQITGPPIPLGPKPLYASWALAVPVPPRVKRPALCGRMDQERDFPNRWCEPFSKRWQQL